MLSAQGERRDRSSVQRAARSDLRNDVLRHGAKHRLVLGRRQDRREVGEAESRVPADELAIGVDRTKDLVRRPR